MMARQASSPDPRFRHVWGGVAQRIFVLDSLRLWTAEEGGRIQFSSDGGATWQAQATPNAIDGYVRGIQFLRRGPNAGKLGWAVGSNGRLIVTTDGGQVWSLFGEPLIYPADHAHAGQVCDLWDVYFQDAQRGWVAGIGVLRSTQDGGVSWTDLLALNPNLPSSVEFYRFTFVGPGANQIAFAAAEPGLIVRSSDGVTWGTALSVPDFCPTLPSDLELWDIQFESSGSGGDIGYAVGGQGNQCGGMLFTPDGGATWTRESSAVLPPTVYGVTALAGGVAIACSYGGRVYRRMPQQLPRWQDISATLNPPADNLLVPLWGAASDGGPHVWICGLMNLVYRSADGGDTWQRQRGAGTWRLRDIAFIDVDRGWAVAQQSTLLRTQDGGQTWVVELANPNAPNLNAIRFRGSTNGIAVGQPNPGQPPSLYAYDASAPQPVWLASSVLAPPVPAPSNAALQSVVWCAPLNLHAWAVGTKGVVMRSTDGSGLVWEYFEGPNGTSGADFESIAFDGVDALYVTGMVRATGAALAYRLRYPNLIWEDLSPGFAGGWNAVAAAPGDVYVAGASAAGKGAVYKFDSASPPGAPHWDLVYPAPGNPAAQVFLCFALVGNGAGRTLFAGGERGAVLRLQGGAWTSLKSETSVTLSGLAFLRTRRGFAVGHGGLDGQGVGSSLALGDSALVAYS
jgi:photosystem II stability/assembly factor-like uncharacterized protein